MKRVKTETQRESEKGTEDYNNDKDKEPAITDYQRAEIKAEFWFLIGFFSIFAVVTVLIYNLLYMYLEPRVSTWL